MKFIVVAAILLATGFLFAIGTYFTGTLVNSTIMTGTNSSSWETGVMMLGVPICILAGGIALVVIVMKGNKPNRFGGVQ